MNLATLKEMSALERKEFLENNASKITEEVYTKPLTEEEIATYKDQLAENSLEQAIAIDEFNKVKEAHKLKVKPMQKAIASALQAIKFKAVDIKGKIFTLQDFDNNMIHEVDEEGNLILSRPPRPDERQHFLRPSITKSA